MRTCNNFLNVLQVDLLFEVIRFIELFGFTPYTFITMEIYAIPGLIATCFLIKQKDLLLIDTGFLGFGKRILKKISKIGKQPRDLKLVVVTHAHIDHFGGLHEVHEHSDALVGCHELDHKGVSRGSKEISPPLTKGGEILSSLASFSLPFMKTRGVAPHVHLEDEMSLEKFGFSGKVIHTPGHTRGSVSVVLEDGSAFTGDLVMGKTAVNDKPSLGAFAENLGDLYRSWLKILKAGAKIIYPAHGKPFSSSELEDLLEKSL